jgi:ATP-dependent DNA helicase RecG
MVILDADRFGIAQLHQLRGRVGRGADASYCYLVGEAATDELAQRLAALERTSDGFELAEIDLECRGEGTVLGTRQKGHSNLKLASLQRDRAEVARGPQGPFLDRGWLPRAHRHQLLREEVGLLIGPEDAEFLFKS